MKVRFLYRCGHCGSTLFRRSEAHNLTERILGGLGIHPERCRRCWRRFFLFKPTHLGAFLRASDATAKKGWQEEPSAPLSRGDLTLTFEAAGKASRPDAEVIADMAELVVAIHRMVTEIFPTVRVKRYAFSRSGDRQAKVGGLENVKREAEKYPT